MRQSGTLLRSEYLHPPYHFSELFLFHHENVCCVIRIASSRLFNIPLFYRSKRYTYIFPNCLITSLYLALSGLNYPCLEQMPMIPQMFEPLRFDCVNKMLRHSYVSSMYICGAFLPSS